MEIEGLYVRKIREMASQLEERLSAQKYYRREKYISMTLAAMKAALDVHLAALALERAHNKSCAADVRFCEEARRWDDVKD